MKFQHKKYMLTRVKIYNNNEKAGLFIMLKVLVITMLALPLNCYATFYDRGNGLIYDDVLDITWMQDALYVKTSGYSIDGFLNWDEALIWADSLVFAGFNDWRLPNIGDNAESGGGISDGEFNHLYHLGMNLYGVSMLDFTGFANGGDSSDIRNFINIQPYHYWYGQSYDPPFQLVWAWVFHTYNGRQGPYFMTERFNVWAVRDGDIFPKGDINGDNEVNSSDLLLLQNYLLGKLSLQQDAVNRANLNPESSPEVVDVADLLALEKILLN